MGLVPEAVLAKIKETAGYTAAMATANKQESRYV